MAFAGPPDEADAVVVLPDDVYTLQYGSANLVNPDGRTVPDEILYNSQIALGTAPGDTVTWG